MADPRQVTLDDVLGGSTAQGPKDLLAKLRRRQGSRDAQKHGAQGEQLLTERYGAAAREHYVARLDKFPTPTAGTPPRLRYSGKAIVDFVGHIKDGSGRHIGLEAKTVTNSDRFSLGQVEPHQREYLDEILGDGCIALLCVIFGEAAGEVLVRPRFYVVPWGEVCALPSVTERELVALGCAVSPEHFLERFLARF